MNGKLKKKICKVLLWLIIPITGLIAIVSYHSYKIACELRGECCKDLKKWRGKSQTDVLSTLGQPVQKEKYWVGGHEGTWWTYKKPQIELFIEDKSGKITHARLYDHQHYFE